MKSLKNALFNEINNAKEEADENAIEFSDIHECSSISAIAKNVCNSSASAIHMTYQLLDESLLEKVAELVILSLIHIYTDTTNFKCSPYRVTGE